LATQRGHHDFQSLDQVRTVAKKRGSKVNFKVIAAVAAGLLSAAPAFSDTITLDFEGAPSFASIADYYNGGAGTNYGISFGLDAQAFSNDEVATNYSNAPSMGAVLGAVGADAALNSSVGFSGTASFFYSSQEATTVNIYSGLNGTGDILGVFTLLANAQSGCSDTPFCHWDQVSVDFGGIAQSIQFGTAQLAGIDNVTIAPVPLPAAFWLLGSSLLGLTGVARRRKA
jgi:hypothetical protein